MAKRLGPAHKGKISNMHLNASNVLWRVDEFPAVRTCMSA
jgi:hypothetical protein